MVDQDQHPGYPWLILMTHKIFEMFSDDASVSGWIYSGRSVALLFRLMAVAVLYFIGKHMIGGRLSFWAVLVLIFLPEPAGYGSDVLSDWPHLFFLMLGILFLLKGSQTGRWWLFAMAGLAAGAGYLIRPESVQVVLAGGALLTLELFRSKRLMSKRQALLAMVMLVVGFALFGGPYMNLKGKLFPKKDVGQLAVNIHNENAVTFSSSQASQFAQSKTVSAIGKLCDNIGKTYMWYFLLPLIIVIRNHILNRKWFEPGIFIFSVLVFLNINVMIWLYRGHGYMSTRHTLPLAVMLIFTVPVGLQELAVFLDRLITYRTKPYPIARRDARNLFVSFVIAGLMICALGFSKSLHIDKTGYIAAAQWLKDNTLDTDVIAVRDPRVSFYAERPYCQYYNSSIPSHTEYYVIVFENYDDIATTQRPPGKLVYEYAGQSKGHFSVAVYQSSAK